MLKKLALLVFFTTFLLMAPSGARARGILRIAYSTYHPFHWVDENGKMTGLFYEIITEALEKRMGLTVAWAAYPWPRCQENLQTGKADAMITFPSEERAAYTVTHKDPIYEKALHLFTCVDHPRITEIKEIREIEQLKKGGFSLITYSGNGWHKENIQTLGIKTYETPYFENIWKMLAQRRGDAVIEWAPGVWPYIERVGAADRIIDTGATIATMPFHLLIRKDSDLASILDEFNNIINTMKEDSTTASISSRYH